MSNRIPVALTLDQWTVVQWAVSQQTDGNARDVSEMARCGLTRREAKHLLAADNEIAVALTAAAPGAISFRESAIVYTMSVIVAAAPKTWADWQSLRDSLLTDPTLSFWFATMAPGHIPAFATALMHEAEDRLPPPSQAPWKAWRNHPVPNIEPPMGTQTLDQMWAEHEPQHIAATTQPHTPQQRAAHIAKVKAENARLRAAAARRRVRSSNSPGQDF